MWCLANLPVLQFATLCVYDPNRACLPPRNIDDSGLRRNFPVRCHRLQILTSTKLILTDQELVSLRLATGCCISICISLLIDLRRGSHHLSNCPDNHTTRQETVGMLLQLGNIHVCKFYLYGRQRVNNMFLSGHASHRQFSDIKALSRPKGINKATTTKNTRFPLCRGWEGRLRPL